MIVTHDQNKTLYNKVSFGTNITDKINISHIHRPHLNFKNTNKVV